MKKLFLALFFLIFVGFFVEGVLMLDPDFGWHIQVGNMITTKGIPLTDPFSYTMPSYHFVDHEWLTDAVMAFIFGKTGMWLLAMIFALLATGAVWFAYQVVDGKNRTSAMLPILLISIPLFSLGGVRAQVITWFFWSFLLWILLQKKKLRLFLPVIFLVWANMHGGFLIGLFLLGIIFSFEMVAKKKIIMQRIILFIVCVLVTFINPYGIALWTEIWKSIADTSLHQTVREWWPALFRLDLVLWLFVALSVSLVVKYKKKFSLLEKVLFGLFLLVALSSMRNIPLWLFVALPITTKSIFFFSQEANKHAITRYKFALATKVLLVFICLLGIFELTETYQEAYGFKENQFYPMQAITYLQNHSFFPHIFSYYGWGGYLIWKMPSEKVFVDGRMPSWRLAYPKKGESQFAFGEYNDFLEKKVSFALLAKKYAIHTIIWPTNSGYEIQFVQAGFRKVYQDPIAEIYINR